MESTTGMNMRGAINLAKQFSCKVWIARRTGEYVIQNPDGKRVRVNLRRKDAPRSLTAFLNKMLPEAEYDCDVGEELNPTNFEEMEMEVETQPIEDVIEPPKPQTLAERIAAMKAEREELETELKSQLASLNGERADLQQMLDDNSSRRANVIKDMRDLGIQPDMPQRTVLDDSNVSDRILDYVPVSDRTKYQDRIRQVLGSRRGVWLYAGDLTRQLKLSSVALGNVVNPLLDSGEVERRGKNKGSMYRIPEMKQ